MLPAVIVLDFDPTVEVAGALVRWETLALAGAILAGLLFTALLAGLANRSDAAQALRRDDLLFLVVAALPGAVVGGRLLHALDFYEFYAGDPGPLLEPGRGSLSLLGAVLGGIVSAGYVGWLLGAPVRRWLDVAIGPLLLAIGLGKLAEVLGGAGQGATTDVPWALAFAGGGPWRSLAPDVPAHPSQVYEGLWVLVGFLIVIVLVVQFLRRVPSGPRVPGVFFGFGLAWWMVGRVVVAFTWRDQAVVGGLNMEQLAALAVLAVVTAAMAAAFVRAGSIAPSTGESAPPPGEVARRPLP